MGYSNNRALTKLIPNVSHAGHLIIRLKTWFISRVCEYLNAIYKCFTALQSAFFFPQFASHDV